MIRQTTIYRLNSIQLITRRHLSTPTLKQNIPKRNNNKFRRYVVYPTAILATGLGGVYWIDKHYYSSVITRSTRAVYILLWIAYQYGFNSHAYSDLNELHEIASDKLMHLLVTNKGIFIKLGQAIANQGRLFPEAYQRKFPMMYDQAPVQSWEHVDRVLKQSLGEDYEGNVFEIINHEPIASASVAQVHYGKLKSGEEVAVKVQHDYISRQLPADLWVYRFISRVYEKVFDIPLSMFTKYVSEKVIEETNFKHEMNNSERLQGLIKDDPSIDNEVIYIPKNFPEFTTEKVLTAEWIGGTPLTHKEILLEKNYDLVGIMNQYIKLFGAQIFKYGFIHSDPHPGNLMVRYLKNGKQQLVLLDHGLYIELPDSFRVEYCNLWRYLFLLDKDGIEEIGKKWGISSLDLFATVVQLRPVLLHPEDTNGEHPDNRNVSDLFRDFIGDKKKFPAELPFLARTMRMIQNLNQSFGSPVNRINLLTKDLVDALLHERHISFVDYWSLIKIRVVLTFSDLMFYFVRIRQYFIGDRYGGKGKGLEDYIEMYMQNTAKSLGMEWI